MVIDRLQVYIFLAVTIAGTMGILMNAPHIFEYIDQEEVRAVLQENIRGYYYNGEQIHQCEPM